MHLAERHAGLAELDHLTDHAFETRHRFADRGRRHLVAATAVQPARANSSTSGGDSIATCSIMSESESDVMLMTKSPLATAFS
jgi:hypothetical protein